MTPERDVPQLSGQLRKIDEICREFETMWHNESGLKESGLNVEEFLKRNLATEIDMGSPTFESFLRELLACEIELRLDRGEQLELDEFAARFPSSQALVEDIFHGVQSGWQPRSSSVVPASRRLGDYQIGREIGRGGMGIVFEATQISTGKIVALKVLPTSMMWKPIALERFRREAQIAQSLRHPNIAEVFDVGCDRNIHFFAMEFCAGSNLSELVKQARKQQNEMDAANRETVSQRQLETVTAESFVKMEPATQSIELDVDPQVRIPAVCEIVAQVADALDYAHRARVLHRDVKPSNIILDDEGHARITDFGLAKIAGDDSLSATGELIGTLRYVAPESLDGEFSTASDIYSLGLTLFELVTLRPAMDSQSTTELLAKINQPLSFDGVHEQIPSRLEQILRRATASKPDDRYLCAATFATELREFLDNKPPRPAAATHSSRGWMATLAIGLAILVAAMLLPVVSPEATDSAKSPTKVVEQLPLKKKQRIAPDEGKSALDTQAISLTSAAVAMRFSPGGELLAVAQYNGRISVWDSTTQLSVVTAELPGPIEQLHWNHDGTILGVASLLTDDHCSIDFLDVNSGEFLVAGIESVAETRAFRQLAIEFSPVSNVALVPHGKYLFRCDLDQQTVEQVLRHRSTYARSFRYDSSGERFAIARGFSVFVYDTESLGVERSTLLRHETEFEEIEWSPDGTQLAMRGGFGICVVSPDRPHSFDQLSSKSPAQFGPVESFGWHKDGQHLYTVGAERVCRFWSTVDWQMIPTAIPMGDAIWWGFHREADHFIVVLSSGEIQTWNWNTGEFISQLELATTSTLRMARYCRETNQLAIAFENGEVQLLSP